MNISNTLNPKSGFLPGNGEITELGIKNMPQGIRTEYNQDLKKYQEIQENANKETLKEFEVLNENKEELNTYNFGDIKVMSMLALLYPEKGGEYLDYLKYCKKLLIEMDSDDPVINLLIIKITIKIEELDTTKKRKLNTSNGVTQKKVKGGKNKRKIKKRNTKKI